jgi:hypothetical protein
VDLPLELLLQKWGPTGLLALCVLLIVLGRLIPKITYDDVRKQRDEWKKVAEEALAQNSKLLESSRVADDTFRALRQVAQRDSESR